MKNGNGYESLNPKICANLSCRAAGVVGTMHSVLAVKVVALFAIVVYWLLWLEALPQFHWHTKNNEEGIQNPEKNAIAKVHKNTPHGRGLMCHVL